MNPEQQRAAVERQKAQVERLAQWLDSKFRIPGTNVRFGADAVAGIIPGVGDTAALIASAIVIAQAVRVGARGWTLARMVALAAVDGIVGTVPIAGTVFDVVFKANNRNVALMRQHVDDPTAATTRSRRSLAVTALVVTAVLVLIVVGVIALIVGLWIWLG